MGDGGCPRAKQIPDPPLPDPYSCQTCLFLPPLPSPKVFPDNSIEYCLSDRRRSSPYARARAAETYMRTCRLLFTQLNEK
jgi:hypothetical protein